MLMKLLFLVGIVRSSPFYGVTLLVLWLSPELSIVCTFDIILQESIFILAPAKVIFR